MRSAIVDLFSRCFKSSVASHRDVGVEYRVSVPLLSEKLWNWASVGTSVRVVLCSYMGKRMQSWLAFIQVRQSVLCLFLGEKNISQFPKFVIRTVLKGWLVFVSLLPHLDWGLGVMGIVVTIKWEQRHRGQRGSVNPKALSLTGCLELSLFSWRNR